MIGMETVVVAHHRNHHQYNGRNRYHGSTKFDSFGSVPSSANFRGMNCRSFESGAGLLPTPTRSCSTPIPVSRNAYSSSPRTPSPPSFNENQKSLARTSKSYTGPIPIKMNFENREADFHFSERWAGPAYSNSPPPSCLPMPKFSIKPKRTVSLDLPKLVTEIDFQPFAKSAPTSPRRERSPSPCDMFDGADSATKTLRRILNLDITDE